MTADQTWLGVDDFLSQRQLHQVHQLHTEAAAARRAGDLWGTALAEARLDQEDMDWEPAKVIPLQQRGALATRVYPDVIA